ncbi:MAG: TorD/DmsD family molecular chaperone [Kineosporiaceae bacterium]
MAGWSLASAGRGFHGASPWRVLVEQVADLYRQAGLDVAPGARELPDHIAVECEAFAWASDAEASPSCADMANALLRDHLRVWLPGFCAAVEEQSALPFYAALAALTRSWVAALPAGRPSGP